MTHPNEPDGGQMAQESQPQESEESSEGVTWAEQRERRLRALHELAEQRMQEQNGGREPLPRLAPTRRRLSARRRALVVLSAAVLVVAVGGVASQVYRLTEAPASQGMTSASVVFVPRTRQMLPTPTPPPLPPFVQTFPVPPVPKCPSDLTQTFTPEFGPGVAVGASNDTWVVGFDGPRATLHVGAEGTPTPYGWAKKILLVMRSNRAEPLTLTGYSLSRLSLWFTLDHLASGANLATTTLTFPLDQGRLVGTSGQWRVWTFYLYIPASDCYALHDSSQILGDSTLFAAGG